MWKLAKILLHKEKECYVDLSASSPSPTDYKLHHAQSQTSITS